MGKPRGDPRPDSSVRRGLLGFRQQSVGRAAGDCERVARRSVVQLLRDNICSPYVVFGLKLFLV